MVAMLESPWWGWIVFEGSRIASSADLPVPWSPVATCTPRVRYRSQSPVAISIAAVFSLQLNYCYRAMLFPCCSLTMPRLFLCDSRLLVCYYFVWFLCYSFWWTSVIPMLFHCYSYVICVAFLWFHSYSDVISQIISLVISRAISHLIPLVLR